MSLVVKKPSDDPYTWLGPPWTVYNFQEDIDSTPEWKNYGMNQSGSFYSTTHKSGNGFFYIRMVGDATNHDAKYIYKDLSQTSSIAVSFDIGGPACSNNIANNEDSSWAGIVMKNSTDGKLCTFGVVLNSETTSAAERMGPSLVIREMSGEYGTSASLDLVGGSITTYNECRIDAAETIILKAQRVTGVHTIFSFSVDGVSFINLDTYTHSSALDTNRLGVGIDVINSADPYTMSIDWVAHT